MCLVICHFYPNRSCIHAVCIFLRIRLLCCLQTSKHLIIVSLFPPTRLCFTRRLFVCLLIISRKKTTNGFCMKILSEMYFWTESFDYILEAIRIRNPDPDLGSGSAFWIRSVFALAICAVRVL